MEGEDTVEDAMEAAVMVEDAMAVVEVTEEAVMEEAADTEEEEMEAEEDMEAAAATNSINAKIGFVPLVVLNRSVLLLCLKCALYSPYLTLCNFESTFV